MPLVRKRTGIFFIASRDFLVEFGQFRVLIQEIGRIKARHVNMRGVEKEQARKIVPVGIEDYLAGGNIRAHPSSALRVIFTALAAVYVLGGVIDIYKERRAQRN